MDLFLESPLAVVGFGLAVVAILGMAWVNSGHVHFLYAIAVAAVLTLVMLIVCQMIETDREAIQRTLYEIAAFIENNDAKLVPRYIVRSAPELAQQGQAEMGRHTFTECRITRIHEIVIDHDAKPPKATVKFNVRIGGDLMKGDLPGFQTVRGFTLVLEKENDEQWRVRSYEHYDPLTFMREEPQTTPAPTY